MDNPSDLIPKRTEENEITDHFLHAWANIRFGSWDYYLKLQQPIFLTKTKLPKMEKTK